MLRWIRKDEQVIQNRYLEMLESELAYYRKKFDDERVKGDRLADELLISRGSLPASSTGVERLEEQEDHARELMDLMSQQMNEIYGGSPSEEEENVTEESADLRK